MATEEISLEELREVLATKGLDIKELAKEAKAIKAENKIPEPISTPATTKKSTGPVFDLALTNYPDFVIRRSTPKTERLMVFMVSQNSYYIKTVKNGIEERMPFTREEYSTFTSGMQEMIMPEGFWIKRMVSGATYYDAVMELLNKDSIRKAIIGGYFKLKQEKDWYGHYDFLRSDEEEMYEAISGLIKSFPDQDLYGSWKFYQQLSDAYGIENARDFIREEKKSLISDNFREDFASYYEYNLDPDQPINMLQQYNLEYKAFKQYVLYDSVRMGLGDNTCNFSAMWADTLCMQMTLYGKVKEKYPRHLQEMHDQLAYKLRIMRKEINTQKFAERVQDAVRFEANIGDYVFLAPKCPQDFYDEATSQSNCLAGYVDRYADGKDYIFFMRLKEMPDVSLVTIELGLDGRLRQAYQAYNRCVTAGQQEAINKWLEKYVNPLLTETVT